MTATDQTAPSTTPGSIPADAVEPTDAAETTVPEVSVYSRAAWGWGLATVATDGQILDTWYPTPALGSPTTDTPPEELNALAGTDQTRQVRREVICRAIDLDAVPEDPADAYLRLHLLSHRLIQPHGANLNGIFGTLANVVWTNYGPCAVAEFEKVRLRLHSHGPVTVLGVDKFPRMVDYVIPSGVRIADADRVRLGAHLAEGTTVMHEGFVNFNAGTLGTSMVEGRISAGVVVGDGSDVGGGASIMGTLSGGGAEVIKVGKRCLIGANAGIGISLGDDCVVEAGCYVTAGTKVQLQPENREVKASELTGVSGVLYRRNSLTGAVQALPREGKTVALNSDLHHHN